LDEWLYCALTTWSKNKRDEMESLHFITMTFIVAQSKTKNIFDTMMFMLVKEKPVMLKKKSYKGMLLGLGLMLAAAGPVFSPTTMNVEYQVAHAASDMGQIQLILKKLRTSMSSMKDFDELEKAGMSTKDVDRMRRAMTQKIEQLTDDAVASIRNI